MKNYEINKADSNIKKGRNDDDESKKKTLTTTSTHDKNRKFELIK